MQVMRAKVQAARDASRATGRSIRRARVNVPIPITTVVVLFVLCCVSEGRATTFRQCRQQCSVQVDTECATLKKRRLRQCRRRIYTQCKRNQLDCSAAVTPSDPPPSTVTCELGVDGGEHQVRVLYVVPTDRDFRTEYSAGIQAALSDLQCFYGRQMGGPTFSIFNTIPDYCRLPHQSDYYASDSWNKVLTDVQECAPVSYGSTQFTWILYVDIVHSCNAPGRLGAGTTGVTMLPRQDLEGLGGSPTIVDDCGVSYTFPVSRWIGGLAHELGHAFGLSHPPGCDSGDAGCDADALMWQGVYRYPDTYLRADDKQILLGSPFFAVTRIE